MSYQYANQNSHVPVAAGPRYPHLSQVLATADGFKRSIAYAGPLMRAAGTVLLIAVVLLMYNINSTVRSLRGSGYTFWQMFFTTNDYNGMNPLYVLFVWGPLVLIPVLAVLMIIRQATLSSAIAQVHADYLRGGFVADLVPTGVRFSGRNQGGYLHLFGAPNVDPATVMGAAQRVTALSTEKGGQARQYKAAMAKLAKQKQGYQAIEAHTADPMLPAGVFIMAQYRTNTPRPVLAVPTGNDFTRLSIHQLKKSAPLS